jgi:hypothetical protein
VTNHCDDRQVTRIILCFLRHNLTPLELWLLTTYH